MLVLVLHVLILTSIMINTNTILINPHPKPRMPAVLEWQDRKIELNLSTAVQQSLVCNSCGSTRERGETPRRLQGLDNLIHHLSKEIGLAGMYCRLPQRRAKRSQAAVNLVVSPPSNRDRNS